MLDYVLYRMGLLAVLRSKYKTGKWRGWTFIKTNPFLDLTTDVDLF